MPESRVVVFYTTVLIPRVLEASLSTRLLDRLRLAGWHVALSPHILAEARDKMLTKPNLRKWLALSDVEITEFLDQDLPGKSRAIPGIRTAHGAVPADPKDDMIVAAALESGASYIISEDKHLLDLGDYQGTKILNGEEFEAELDRLEVE
jgi:putative PIN family toxin of toxin-antitoxin system